MTYKHPMTGNKVWSHAATAGFSPAGLIAKLMKAVKVEIPTGYQDESGFHTGVKPTGKEIQWPTVW